MNQLVITALLILGGLIIAVLIYEMPFIYGSAYTAPMELGNDSLIIAISDLHLESNERDLGCIGNYLRGGLGEDGIYLIINGGDLFDKAHGQVLGQSHITELIRRLGLAGISELRGGLSM